MVDVALPPIAAKEAISILRSAGVAVIGGEVWGQKNSTFFQRYDIWNVEEDDYSSQEKYVRASLDIAHRQVDEYLQSEECVYIVVGV